MGRTHLLVELSMKHASYACCEYYNFDLGNVRSGPQVDGQICEKRLLNVSLQGHAACGASLGSGGCAPR